MFGLIASGRLVSTKWEQASPTNFITEIHDADSVNHVVVFLTGQLPFPEGLGGAVYFSWPQPEGGQTWQLLGTISNSKPSAIFRVAKLKQSSMKDDNKENITNSFMEFGQSMVENLFNYASSFALSAKDTQIRNGETFVPLSVLQKWFQTFQRRFQQNPNFWRK